MFDVKKIMEVPGIPTLLSFLIGLGVASMLRPACRGPECVVIRGPPVQDIRDAVYQFGSKCVEFQPKAVECPKEGMVGIVDTVSFVDYSG